MDTRSKQIKRLLFAMAGLLAALLFSAPYLIFREQLREMTVVGYAGLFLACAISNVSVLIPSSATVVVLAAATVLNPWLCILCGGLGTALGEQSSYLCGLVGARGFDADASRTGAVREILQKHAFLTVFLFALVPLPVFDIVGLAAGAARVNWVTYTLAAALGKTLKFLFIMVSIFYVVPAILGVLPGRWDAVLEQGLGALGIRY